MALKKELSLVFSNFGYLYCPHCNDQTGMVICSVKASNGSNAPITPAKIGDVHVDTAFVEMEFFCPKHTNHRATLKIENHQNGKNSVIALFKLLDKGLSEGD